MSAAVIDCGSYEFRAGYSGEDQPRSVIPSCAGVIDGQSALDDQQDVVMEESKNARFISGYNDIGFKRENMRIQPLYQEEGTLNFDVFEELLEKSLIKNLSL